MVVSRLFHGYLTAIYGFSKTRHVKCDVLTLTRILLFLDYLRISVPFPYNPNLKSKPRRLGLRDKDRLRVRVAITVKVTVGVRIAVRVRISVIVTVCFRVRVRLSAFWSDLIENALFDGDLTVF